MRRRTGESVGNGNLIIAHHGDPLTPAQLQKMAKSSRSGIQFDFNS